MQNKKTTAILLSVLAAAFYAVNVPFSKLLLNQIGSDVSGVSAVFRRRNRHRHPLSQQSEKARRREKADTQRPALYHRHDPAGYRRTPFC